MVIMLENADAILLARIQFAFTIAFHILFPAFTIGLASYLAVLEGLYVKTRNLIYLNSYNYWLKIFAVAFGMGVVSGIVMTYQFGSNWSVFSDRTAPILGDRKSTRLNSSHVKISYAVFCLKKKN